ncbi:hypothetical protein H0A36_21235 [Endozoicomonas sp. SM1973]|uniref:Uncharacterized protein n=1 Tax=Spartinivicinus marinus TaxID=2994442 RepID=A0A853I9T8_9GAMM|nr:hypothetical protein [Spartinivicinus marinus]MCX4027738.1 hypothetical protein [Spartinivicinus marinus]NYZ68542.1 hypothetical protein [Spartinivicinus marinus]
MKKKLANIAIMAFLLSAHSLTNASGKITGISFSGPDDDIHSNLVQIQIEGGYNSPNCDITRAAIRNTEDRQHLIKFALTAFKNETPVDIVLMEEDKYFRERCTIKRISTVRPQSN